MRTTRKTRKSKRGGADGMDKKAFLEMYGERIDSTSWDDDDAYTFYIKDGEAKFIKELEFWEFAADYYSFFRERNNIDEAGMRELYEKYKTMGASKFEADEGFEGGRRRRRRRGSRKSRKSRGTRKH